MNRNELIQEIDMCLERNDISQIDFTILHSLRYLLENGYFPLNQIIKRTAVLPIKPAHVDLVTSPEREKEIKDYFKNLYKPNETKECKKCHGEFKTSTGRDYCIDCKPLPIACD